MYFMKMPVCLNIVKVTLCYCFKKSMILLEFKILQVLN